MYMRKGIFKDYIRLEGKETKRGSWWQGRRKRSKKPKEEQMWVLGGRKTKCLFDFVTLHIKSPFHITLHNSLVALYGIKYHMSIFLLWFRDSMFTGSTHTVYCEFPDKHLEVIIVVQLHFISFGKRPSYSCLVMLCNDEASLQKSVALDIFGIFKKRLLHFFVSSIGLLSIFHIEKVAVKVSTYQFLVNRLRQQFCL